MEACILANATRHCSQCGTPIPNISQRFCTSCGAGIPSDDHSSQPTPSTDLFGGLKPVPQTRGNQFRSCVLIPVFFLIIFFVAGGIISAIVEAGTDGPASRIAIYISLIVSIVVATLITKFVFGRKNRQPNDPD